MDSVHPLQGITNEIRIERQRLRIEACLVRPAVMVVAGSPSIVGVLPPERLQRKGVRMVNRRIRDMCEGVPGLVPPGTQVSVFPRRKWKAFIEAAECVEPLCGQREIV